MKFCGIFVLVLALSILCVPVYAAEASPSDEIVDFSEEYWSDIIDHLDDPDKPIFDFVSSVGGVTSALTFVSSYVSSIWDAIPDAFMVVLTLPILMGVFFYLCSHARIPDTRPEPGDYATSESWTTTVTSRNGGSPDVVESHTVTTRRV